MQLNSSLPFNFPLVFTLVDNDFDSHPRRIFFFLHSFVLILFIASANMLFRNIQRKCDRYTTMWEASHSASVSPMPPLKFTLKVSSSEVVSVNSALMPFQKMFSLLLKLLIGLLKVWNKTLISQLRLCKVWPPGIIWTQSSIWWHCLRPGKGVVTRARKWRYVCRCVKTQW